MSGWGSASELSVGGRSPKAADGREQYRTSRRLGLTHSLTPPRPPDLPARPVQGAADDLPRPRSVSPPRKPLPPPSVKGSALSARLERASVVRGVPKVDDGPPPIPPPVTRARFSVKLGEAAATTGIADDVGGGGGSGNGRCNGNVGRTGMGNSALKVGEEGVGAVEDAVVASEEAKEDETPVVVLPSTLSEVKKVCIEEEAGGGRGRRGRGGGLVDSRSPRGTSSGIAAATTGDGGSAFGVGRSQIQASPQRWVPRKLSRSPKNMKKSGSVSTSPKANPRW